GTMTMLAACHMPETRTIQHAVPGIRRIDVKTGLAIGRWDDWPAIWIEGLRRAHAADPAGESQSPLDLLRAGFGQSADYHAAIESGRITTNGFGIAVTAHGEAFEKTVT